MRILKRLVVVSVLAGIGMCGVCGRPCAGEQPGFSVLIRMMDIQDRWFRRHIVAPFAQSHHTKITVMTFDKFWDLEVMLQLDAASKQPSIGVVKVPLEMTRPLASRMRAYDDMMDEKALRVLKEAFDPKALALGTINGKLIYLPRKLETRMMVYLKSRVSEAVAGWGAFKTDINEALRADNGYGLPAGYRLEADPNQWDFYDLFVVAYTWAHTPYFGIKMPRMAHRGKKYGGTVVGLTDRIYQLGGTAADVLKVAVTPVVDMFVWESVFKKNGLYHPGMWQDPWSGGGIWNAMKDGKVFLAMMHQIDTFYIHGGTHPAMQGYLVDPDDLGVAVMPRGVSFALDENGRPVRTGGRRAGTSGWFWAIPKTAPKPGLCVEFARWITNHENHLAECRTFGMMPVRGDILVDLKAAFPKGWMADVFAVSVRQFALNGTTTVPLVSAYTKIGKIYLEAWYDIVVGEHFGSSEGVDEHVIRERLNSIYAPRARKVFCTQGGHNAY